MEFFELVTERKSVREFEPRAPAEEKLRKVLETANLAPSAGNLQSYEIYVVRRAADRAALARAALGQGFVASAPVSLVFCAHPARAEARYGRRGTNLYAVQDATIACTYAMLSITALGMATVWVGAFREEEVRRAIRAPEGVVPVAILPVGYPAEKPEPTSRRELADLVHEL